MKPSDERLREILKKLIYTHQEEDSLVVFAEHFEEAIKEINALIEQRVKEVEND